MVFPTFFCTAKDNKKDPNAFSKVIMRVSFFIYKSIDKHLDTIHSQIFILYSHFKFFCGYNINNIISFFSDK